MVVGGGAEWLGQTFALMLSRETNRYIIVSYAAPELHSLGSMVVPQRLFSGPNSLWAPQNPETVRFRG